MSIDIVHQKDPHNMEVFLDLIKDYPIILNCSKVPKIVAEKERAIEIVCKRYKTEVGNPITKLKLLKKVNNLKTRFKTLSKQAECGKTIRPWTITFANLLKENGILFRTRGQEIVGSDIITKRERAESNNEIFLDEISSHIDDDIDEDSISFTESIDPKQTNLQLNSTAFVEFTGPTTNINEKVKEKSKFLQKKPKYVIPGETEETKWLTTKQLERMALIEHINFSKVQREYYAEKLKIMRK